MAGFLSRLFGGGKKEDGGTTHVPSASAKTKRLREFYRFFEDHDAALPKLIADYVVGGSNSAVLSTLSTPKVQKAWHNRYQSRRYNSEEYSGLFRIPLPWTAAEIARVGDVSAAVEPVGVSYDYGLGGTSISPDWLRRVLSAYGEYTNRVRTIPLLLEMVQSRGLGLEVALDMVFSPNTFGYQFNASSDAFDGVEAWIKSDHVAIIEAAQKLKPGQRALIAAAAGRYNMSDAYLDLIIEAGLAPSKGGKKAARGAIVSATKSLLSANLDVRFAKAKPGARVELIELAVAGLGADAIALLESWRALENSAAVSTALNQAISKLGMVAAPDGDNASIDENSYIALDDTVVSFPPCPEIPEFKPIPQSVFALLEPSVKSYNAHFDAEKRAHRGQQWSWTKYASRIDPFTFQAMKNEFETGDYPKDGKRQSLWHNFSMAPDRSGIDAFLAHPDVGLRALMRLYHHLNAWSMLNLFGDNSYGLMRPNHVRRITEGNDIRVLAKLWKEAGGEDPVSEVLMRTWYSDLGLTDPEVLAPLVVSHFDLLDEAFGMRPQSGVLPANLRVAVELLNILPKVPKRYLIPLMSLASGGTKTQRQAARHLLKEAQGIETHIAGLLKDGKQDMRAGAADWLSQRGAKAHIGDIRAALTSEKSDTARAAMITALERLGDDVSDLFDPIAMMKEAETGLAKTALKGLEWFPFDLMPRVAWKTGTPVDPILTKWWVVLAAKLKTPGGNALLDLWLDRLVDGDAHKFGWFILTSWSDCDTRQTPPEEANAYAAANIDTLLANNQKWAKQNPQYASYYVTDRDKLFAQLRNEKLNTYLGTATESKGILALTTKVDGNDASRLVRAYLKNHGSRLSQCKALLDSLASNGSSAAIQVLLATSNRFKARTVQAHATTLIEDLAEQRGWTQDELADRTIPTGGLDETGSLELDCGPDRTYKIILDETDTVCLLNPDGKKVSTLPSARVDDEKPLIDEAKRLLTTARKEVKQILPDQITRLREAMLLQRTWTSEDWTLYVRGHVLVGRIAQRMVWMALDEDNKVLNLFRPLDDGTLTDVEDRDYDLSGARFVQPAHSSLVDRATRDAWRAHLEAYEVKSPFDQFGSAQHVLEPDQAEKNIIEDRRGWMIESFALRGIATKLGYVRGAAEDGGWFSRYERRYQSANIIAAVDFSGSPLPEENKPSVLYGLSFTKLRRGSDQYGTPMSLKDVPPVLLAQSWQDLHDIADKGTGFNPNWETHNAW
jgi:hypothetical protein